MKTEIILKYLSKAVFIACFISSTVYAADVKQSALATKTTPVTGDKALIIDSADGNKSKNVTLGSLPLSTATQTALDLKSNISCFSSETSFNACFTLDWPTGGGIASWSDVQALISGSGDYIKYDGTRGDPTGSVDLSAYLSKTNTTAFTPTADYHPATKKYVDDSITAGGGYTDEQAQDAAGAMFSGNTETGITVTYNDTTGKVDFVVATQSDVNFTSTLNAKLAGIATGAEVNVNADWNSSSGDSQILNKPTIPTISDTAYGVSWNGDTGAASKNAIYDKIETIAGGSMTYPGAGIAVSTGSAWGTSLSTGTSANNVVQLNSSGELPFTLDLMDLTSGGTAISPPGTTGYALTASTTGVITWAAMSGGIATTDIDTSAELDTIVTDDTGSGALVFATSPTLVTPALGTPSALVLTNATNLPLSSVVDSTTEALGAGTIELGSASDTTIARSGAGVLTVEGVTVTRTIASNATALGTSAIGSGACASVVTATATGTATTDTIGWGFNGDPTSTTGYNASANGMLTIIAYPTANNVNFKVCNNTAASITPGAVTLNWKVFR